MWWCSRGRMDYRGRGRWVKEEMGKRKRGREQGEIVNQLLQDRRKPFIPTLSPHKNIQLLSLLHLPCIQMQCLHTLDRQLSLSLTHTHIQSSLQTNALLIKYWRGPVANWADTISAVSRGALRPGKKKKSKEEQSGMRKRHKGKRKGERKGWEVGKGRRANKVAITKKMTGKEKMEDGAESQRKGEWGENCYIELNTKWQTRSCIQEQKQSLDPERLVLSFWLLHWPLQHDRCNRNSDSAA